VYVATSARQLDLAASGPDTFELLQQRMQFEFGTVRTRCGIFKAKCTSSVVSNSVLGARCLCGTCTLASNLQPERAAT
jgi:hypothetical protein